MIQNIRLEQFERWLSRFADNEIVGKPREFCDCPLARCLKDLNPYYNFRVEGRYFLISEPPLKYVPARESVLVQFEPWQDNLVLAVDRLNDRTGVTASDVRELMKGLDAVHSHRV